MASQLRQVSVTTAFSALPDLRCGQVSILNNTGADLDVRMASETTAACQTTLKDGQSMRAAVVSNAREIQIKAAAGASGVNLVID